MTARNAGLIIWARPELLELIKRLTDAYVERKAAMPGPRVRQLRPRPVRAFRETAPESPPDFHRALTAVNARRSGRRQ